MTPPQHIGRHKDAVAHLGEWIWARKRSEDDGFSATDLLRQVYEEGVMRGADEAMRAQHDQPTRFPERLVLAFAALGVLASIVVLAGWLS